MPFPKKHDVREPIPARVEIDLTHTVGRWRGFGSTVFSFQEPELVERPGERVGEVPPEEIREELLKMVYHEVRLNRGRIFPFRYERELAESERKRPASEWSKDDLVRRGINRVLDYLLPAMEMGLNEIIGSVGVWDMPPHMTETNGRTLKSEAFEEYVERVMRVLDYWRAEYGLELIAWSLFNEPNFPLHEPTALSPKGHVRLTRMLGKAFAKAKLSTRIMVADDWSPRHRTLDIARTVLSDSEAREFVRAVAYHSYDGYDFLNQDWRDFDEERRARKELKELCDSFGAEVWMTEVSNYRPALSDWHNTFFRMSEIHDDITCGGIVAWDFMLGLWQGNWRSGARGGPQGMAEFYYEPDGTVRRTQLTNVATAVGHWSRAISPDWNVLSVSSNQSDLRVTAFLSPDRESCVCVLLQDAIADMELELRLVGGVPADVPVVGFRSNPIDRWGEIAPVLPEQGYWQMRLPRQSATTLFLPLRK